MNKDSIYKLIGYNGEYTANVKKAIRKLLKENHPDNNGNRKIFELISEVKKELEENKVSYNSQKTTNNSVDDIDYDYCFDMIKTITKEKELYTSKLNKLENKLKEYNEIYAKEYHEDIKLETDLLANSKNVDIIRKTKLQCVICLLMAIVFFIIAIWKQNIVFLILFVLVALICILIVNRSFVLVQNITESSKNRLKKYVGMNSKLRNNLRIQEDIKKDIHELKKLINNLDNDLRFYNNLFNNRR